MTFSIVTSFACERPTLPPLHTLNLPHLTRKPAFSYDSYEPQSSCPRLHVPQKYHRSSSTSTIASTSSPSHSLSCSPLSLRPSRSNSPNMAASTITTPTHTMTRKLRLIPCSLETADAVILVTSPDAPYIPLKAGSDNPNPNALLLVGPALEKFRHPQRTITKGARVHPYRFAHTPGSRRGSEAAM
ncbi:uncharacterized protein LACBIDRAFT_297776 [Laccaria bicolor S238N-H82]|uniref:Predicted protein n=1 Tax=Laccaria bicolor (strain S238N-H82 / ATCC MYA-4686) TaxID=486041 RepID=B0DAV1_LACBS|nr:uncharacterized protein LACBIDRAFT_297776 [Laccaria bicolor S238N-H82]EDR08093.1 predicted protein [Laccaria bicolor S238N-H82]|eukprot:XP_001881163.1 predicted protein [Laccaria bicolor S238N-H82]